MAIPSASRSAYTNGTIADATAVNSNEDNIVSAVNACITEVNNAAGASVNLTTRLSAMTTATSTAQSAADAAQTDADAAALVAAAALPATSYTAADVMAKVQSLDGTGSGLDADLLDGNHASVFTLLSDFTTASNEIVIPGGIKFKTGQFTSSASNPNAVAFASTFATACIFVVVQDYDGRLNAQAPTVGNVTTSGFDCWVGTAGYVHKYLAIGY